MSDNEKELTVSEAGKINESLKMFGDHIEGISVLSEEELDEMFGGEEGDNLDDLGKETNLTDEITGDEADDPDDVVDDAMMELVDLVAKEYEEESAMNAVYDAVGSLVDSGEIEDMPSIIAKPEQKILWVQNSIPKIKARLKDFGIEWNEGAETIGGAEY